MYLYEKNNSKIDVFLMKPNDEKIYEFKKREMSKIDEDKRVLNAITNSRKILEEDIKVYLDSDLNYQKIDRCNGTLFHELCSYELDDFEKERQNKLLEKYYNSNVAYNKQIKKVKNNKDIIYIMLLSSKYYRAKFSNDIYFISNIINLTKNLYFFEMFSLSNFDNLKDEIIIKLLDLYDFIGKVSEVDYEEIIKLNKFDLIDTEEKQIVDKLKKSEKILKLVK